MSWNHPDSVRDRKRQQASDRAEFGAQTRGTREKREPLTLPYPATIPAWIDGRWDLEERETEWRELWALYDAHATPEFVQRALVGQTWAILWACRPLLAMIRKKHAPRNDFENAMLCRFGAWLCNKSNGQDCAASPLSTNMAYHLNKRTYRKMLDAQREVGIASQIAA